MKRWGFGMAMLALAAFGCDDNNKTTMSHDMAMKMVGMDAAGSSGIGSPCTSTDQCTDGSMPMCIKDFLSRTGICSASCSTDTDCGDGNVCLFAPRPGTTDPMGVCTKSCMTAADCVPSNTACWVSLSSTFDACWPKDGVQVSGQGVDLDCDPTVVGCTFNGSKLPGACERQIAGTGNAGSCRQSCDIGVGTCPDTADGTPQSCYFFDETLNADGTPNGDKFKGTICEIIAQVASSTMQGAPLTFIADGSECLDPTDATMTHFYDICLPGSMCELPAVTGGTKTISGATADNLCHQLCYLGNYTPPDMGELFSDGGAVASTTCRTGTCTDVFNASGLTTLPGMPVGLCM